MASESVEAQRAVSAALFNNRYLVEVLLQVHRRTAQGQATFTTRELAGALGVADSLVRTVLLRLVDAGVLHRLPRLSGGRSAQYYSIADRQLEEALHHVAAAVAMHRAHA